MGMGIGETGSVSTNTFALRMRGLPYRATEKDVVNFFQGITIVPGGIHFLMNASGRPSGEGYVEFPNAEEAEKAMAKHNQRMMHRYIELFRASKQEVQIGINRSAGFAIVPQQFQQPQQFFVQYPTPFAIPPQIPPPPPQATTFPMQFSQQQFNQIPLINQLVAAGCVVHMKGLPFSATIQDIAEFFHGFALLPAFSTIIVLPDGRSSGCALAAFISADEVFRVIQHKNRTEMSGRNIDLTIAK